MKGLEMFDMWAVEEKADMENYGLFTLLVWPPFHYLHLYIIWSLVSISKAWMVITQIINLRIT
jgi:hypothetical protein